MLDDIYKIGLIAQKNSKQIMDNSIIPDKISKMDKVYSIDFDKDFQYLGVSIQEFRADRQYQYLLRKKASNGINFGPTSQITEIEKTVENKIVSWFKEFENEESKIILEEMKKNEIKIIEEIKRNFNKKEKSLLTVKVDEKFPFDIQWIFQNYEKLVKETIFGNDLHKGTCYVCKKKDVPIVPEYGVYKFYTKDKPGFIAGGFSEKDFWRNCPVCTECQPIINAARQFIEENLMYKYYGLNFYIIPSTIGNSENLEEVISILTEANKKYAFDKNSKAAFELDNEQILYVLKDTNDISSFRIFFVQKSNSAERILLDIKDIYPSRFKTMYKAKELIDENYKELLKFENKDKQIERIRFNFSFFREFLNKSDDKNSDNDLNKIFLGLTESIFYQNKIKLETILIHIMRKLRRYLLSEEFGRLNFSTLKAIAGIQYLITVGCLERKEEEIMKSNFDNVFEKYQCGLDNNVKKALVLVGALVQKVLNIQLHEIKSTPFTKNLKSLQLREDEVKGLVAQAVNKMMEYGYYSAKSEEIVEEISKLIFASNDKWSLSVDEINFYIVAGMALQKEIYGKEEEKENE